MARSRAAVDAALARGDAVYGLTTGVGVLKRVPLAADEVVRFNRRLLQNHRVAQGVPVAPDVVRATMLRLANGFAAGHAGVRYELAQRLVEALNRGVCPVVRELGSLGESDLAPLADLAAGLFGDPDLAAGEGLAVLNNNAFSTATAALAVHDAGGCSTPPTPPARSASRRSPPTSPSCTRRSSRRGPTKASRWLSGDCAACSTAATCGAKAPPATCRTRLPSARSRGCTAPATTLWPTCGSVWPWS